MERERKKYDKRLPEFMHLDANAFLTFSLICTFFYSCFCKEEMGVNKVDKFGAGDSKLKEVISLEWNDAEKVMDTLESILYLVQGFKARFLRNLRKDV